MTNKDKLILTAAIVVPGGLLALGIWKALELMRKKNVKNDNDTDNDPNGIHGSGTGASAV